MSRRRVNHLQRLVSLTALATSVPCPPARRSTFVLTCRALALAAQRSVLPSTQRTVQRTVSPGAAAAAASPCPAASTTGTLSATTVWLRSSVPASKVGSATRCPPSSQAPAAVAPCM